jgi:hypothetical protein
VHRRLLQCRPCPPLHTRPLGQCCRCCCSQCSRLGVTGVAAVVALLLLLLGVVCLPRLQSQHDTQGLSCLHIERTLPLDSNAMPDCAFREEGGRLPRHASTVPLLHSITLHTCSTRACLSLSMLLKWSHTAACSGALATVNTEGGAVTPKGMGLNWASCGAWKTRGGGEQGTINTRLLLLDVAMVVCKPDALLGLSPLSFLPRPAYIGRCRLQQSVSAPAHPLAPPSVFPCPVCSWVQPGLAAACR